MSKADLKAAMESLQVKKPLRLPGKMPQFKAPSDLPQVSTETQASTATQVAENTPAVTTTVCDSTPVTPRTQAPAPSSVDRQTTGAVVTEVGAATPVLAATKVVEGRTYRPSDQDSAVVLEAQTASKLNNEYTRIPNSLLMRMVTGDLQRSEMQLLLVIARFTISFQRTHAPLSKAVLERQTGLRGPAILQAASELIAKGLIEKIPGDQYRPNQLGLLFDEVLACMKRDGEMEVSAATPAEVENSTYFKLARCAWWGSDSWRGLIGAAQAASISAKADWQ